MSTLNKFINVSTVNAAGEEMTIVHRFADGTLDIESSLDGVRAALEAQAAAEKAEAEWVRPHVLAYMGEITNAKLNRGAKDIASEVSFRLVPGATLADGESRGEARDAVLRFLDANTGTKESGALFGAARGRRGTFLWSSESK